VRFKATSGEKSGDSSSDGGSAGHGHGRDHGGGHSIARSNSREKWEDANGADGPKKRCYYRCGKPGHFAHEC
jgi:hypothetical protein